MANVNVTFNAQYTGTQIPSTGVLTGQALTIPEVLSIVMPNGTPADKINLIAAPTFLFVGTTPQSANLLTMTDILGAAIIFARVRMIIFKLYGTTTDGVTVTIGAASSNPWTGILNATGTFTMQAPSPGNPNGSFAVFTAPNTTGFLAGSASKSIQMTPSANCSLDMLVFGADV